MADKKQDARQGWKSRRSAQRDRRRRQSPEERAQANAARAELVAQLRGERTHNEDVRPAGDYIAQMSDADLWAHYHALTGSKPNGRAKRDTVEAAVRRIEAERAASRRDDERVEGDDV